MNRRLFVLAGTAFGATLAARKPDHSEAVYHFACGGYDIRMSVEYFDAYTSDGFWFRDRRDNNRFCFSGNGDKNRNCLPDFSGSIAIARYHIRPCCDITLREYVRTIDHDNHLPARPPFEYAITLENGIASDVQAFGYQLNTPQPRLPASAPNGPWCFVRQDLYLGQGGSPFLVIHWKHTLRAIRLLDAIPGDQTRLIAQPERR